VLGKYVVSIAGLQVLKSTIDRSSLVFGRRQSLLSARVKLSQ